MAQFNAEDIEIREFTVFEDRIFFSDTELTAYIDSCDASFKTHNFFRDSDDIFEIYSVQELLDICYDGQDEEMLYQDAAQYDVMVDKLMQRLDIHCKRGRRMPGDAIEYTLYGTYKNLKEFAKKYSGFIDYGEQGRHLADCEKEADIDFESGDESFILGKLSM